MRILGDLIGSGEAQERGIVGETPNLAGRLQSIAEPNSVIIANSTRSLLGNLFQLQDLGSLHLKGITGSVRAWRVVRQSTVESRFEALHATGLTALVGREEETNLLLRRWVRAKGGEGQVVLLAGEPGIGKSRLVAAVLDSIGPETHTRVRHFCSPHHAESALYPFIQRLERAAGFEYGDDAQARVDKLDALLVQTCASGEDREVFAELLSLPLGERYPRLDLTPQQWRKRTIEAIMRQFEVLAGQQPVLAIFEDVHWIDPSSLDVLSRMIDRVRSLGVLLIVSFRPEFNAPWTGVPHVTLLTLNRLERRDCRELVQRVTGNKAIPGDVVHEIVERTDGVPLFIEEMTKAVLEAGESAAFCISSAVPSTALSVPATLHASLMARLDRLASAKEVAQIGAAIGREFSYDLLAAVTPFPKKELEQALDRLKDAGLVYRQGTPPDASYLFKHALVQDAAYGMLLRGPRQDMHARIADALLSMGSEKPGAAPEIIAHHLQSAGRSADAIRYWHRAGEQAVLRAANREAIEHLRRALSLVGAQAETAERWRSELAILSRLGPALMSVHGWSAPEVSDAFERAGQIGRRLESSADLAPSIAGLWLFNIARGRFDRADEIAGDLRRIAYELGDPEIILQAHHTKWPTCWMRGQFLEADEEIDAGVALYDEDRHRHHRYVYLGHDPAVCGLAIGAIVQWVLGYPTKAMRFDEQALALARRLKHAPSLAQALSLGCELRKARDDPRALTHTATELLALSEEQSLPQFRATALMFLAWA